MHMSKFITSLFLIPLCLAVGSAQEASDNIVVTDSMTTDSLHVPVKFGIRLGADLSGLGRSVFTDNFQGFELQGDYRITERIYAAGEIGSADRNIDEPNINFSSKGTYIKLGGDFNFYRNWEGMDNMIYGGMRLGLSKFSQTINSYTTYTTNQSWPSPETISEIKYDNLGATWIEFQFGMKVELLPNIFGSVNFQLKRLISNKSDGNIDNLYIPGFNRTYEDGQIGAGMSYGISYRIPFYKK